MREIEKAKHAIKIIMTAEPDAEKAAEVALVAIAHALIAIAEQLSVVASSLRCPECGGMLISGECPQQMCSWKPWERHEDGT